MTTTFFCPSTKIDEQAFGEAISPGFVRSAQTPIGNLADLSVRFALAVDQALASAATAEWLIEGPTWLARNADWLTPIIGANPRCDALDAVIGALRFAEVGIRTAGIGMQIEEGDMHDADLSGPDYVDELGAGWASAKVFLFVEAFGDHGWIGWELDEKRCRAAAILLADVLDKLKPIAG